VALILQVGGRRSAMQFSIFDASAQAFARDFYEMLTRFKPLDECVSRAREALFLEVRLGHRDWATPVLFMRAPDGQLFAPSQEERHQMAARDEGGLKTVFDQQGQTVGTQINVAGNWIGGESPVDEG